MNIPFLRPAFCPAGVDPADWRKALMQRIEQQATILTNLIDALDVMDGDCDLEANGDAEPWLGWCAGMAIANASDLEIEETDCRDRLPIIDIREEAR